MTSSDSHRIIVIAGTQSNSGKTTLLCDLLRELTRREPWEAIKLTRGHYRSCGKDPHACCVSHLLSEQPVIRSGREETYAFGKDTGRYWDAGASDVHWVIVTENQVEQGIRLALSRVKSGGVLIEGTSVLKFIDPDFAVMVARADRENQPKMKPSARRALAEGFVDAIYLSGLSGELSGGADGLALQHSDLLKWAGGMPVYTNRDLPQLIAGIRDHQSFSR
jgi:molybdopterin-guanine dinucleotide biosynthesis protein